jgi:hypothetical protein
VWFLQDDKQFCILQHTSKKTALPQQCLGANLEAKKNIGNEIKFLNSHLAPIFIIKNRSIFM